MSSTKSKTTLPLTITGGCLCVSIRYSIIFPEDAVWPPKDIWTCQCTQCRKFTGCLLPQNISIPTSYIKPNLSAIANTDESTLKTFESSKTAYRSFCGKCGSSIAFNERETPQLTEIFMGTLDESVLCGSVGEELCRARQHIWAENGIKGVTDGLVGDIYLKNRVERWRVK